MSNQTPSTKPNDAEQESGKGLDETPCSPSSLTPETDALRDSYENYEHRTNTEDLWELCASMERERNELAGYLCRAKLPLPVRFVADLADVFPGENIRMKDEGGYLCIFSENAIGEARADNASPSQNQTL